MERPERFFVASSSFYLLAWLLASLQTEAAGKGSPFLLGTLGFAGMLIFAYSYHMVPRFWAGSYGAAGPKYLHLVLANAGLLGTVLTSHWLFPSFWLLGASIFVLVISRSPKGGELDIRPVSMGGPVDHLALAFLGAAYLYLVLGSSMLLLGESPSVLHVFLLGFVLNAVFGFVYRMVAVFLGSAPSPVPVGAQLSLSVAGPALVAAGLAGVVSRGVFLAGALIESGAAVLFAANLARMYLGGEPGRGGPTGFCPQASPSCSSPSSLGC